MTRPSLTLSTCLAMLAASCTGRGAEGGRCYPNATCDDGLVCLSDRCVLVPSSDAAPDAGGDAGDDAGSDAGSDGGAACGNGMIDGTERCDGDDLGGASCTTVGQGFTGGTLACDGACLYDYTACTIPPGCGDGAIDPPEQCDGGEFGGMTCQTLGFATGGLSCALGCIFDATGCWTCGDGLIQPIETCDGTSTGGATCASLGFGGGTLGCASDCFALDPSSCTGGPPSIPAPRSPINNSYMGSIFVAGSRRPTFTWEPSTVAGGAAIDYELQYSSSSTFSSGVTTAAVTGTSYQPPTDLTVSMTAPVGTRYYWRVRACAAAVCSAYSGTRWVNVGRSDRDFNGDGFADIVIGAPNSGGGSLAGAAYVYLGGAPLPSSMPVLTLMGAPGQFFGNSVASAGDLDGDGYSDLVIGANSALGGDPGHAFVYRGGAGAAFDATPDATLTGEALADYFGNSVAAAGDVNADGFDDLLVGAFFNDGTAFESGAAYLFLGGPGSLDATADAVFEGVAASDHFGNSVAGAGDVNGDGFADIVIGAQNHAASAGAAYVYLGGPGAAPDSVADGILLGEAAGDAFGQPVLSAGDLDGDGFSELLIGALAADGGGYDRGRAYVYDGGPGTTFDASADLTLTGTTDSEFFGTRLVAADLNADGHVDVGISSTEGGFGYVGQVLVYFGSSTGLDATPESTLAGLSAGAGFGGSLSGGGDVNGDGYADLIVGAWGSGSVFVFIGGAGGSLDAVADETYTGAPGESYGQSVY